MSQAPSGFDPAKFLDAQTDTPNIKRPPLPKLNPTASDGFYIGVIGEVKTDAGTIEKGERSGQPWLAMLVPISIEVPPQVQDQLGIKLEKGVITLTDRVFIDLTAQGSIDNSVGRNRRQRQYRDALDLNKPGDTWSWRLAQGRPLKLTIDQEIFEGDIQERVGLLLKR